MDEEMISKAKYLAKNHFKGKDAGIRAKVWLFHALNQNCIYCDCNLTLDNIQLDHWMPQSSKVSIVEDDTNFVPSCQSCNLAKGALNGDEFICLMEALEDWEFKCENPDVFNPDPTGNATKKFILTVLKNAYKKAYKR